MSLKKRIVFALLAIVSLLAIFVLLDNFYFHLFLNKAPVAGTCLILEQKYCNTGKLVYGNNGEIRGITFKIKTSTPLISPSTTNISGGSSNENSIKYLTIGKNLFDNPESENLWYRISFMGEIEENYKDNLKINKGDIFARTVKDEKGDSWVFLSVENVTFKNKKLETKINETIINSLLKKK